LTRMCTSSDHGPGDTVAAPQRGRSRAGRRPGTDPSA